MAKQAAKTKTKTPAKRTTSPVGELINQMPAALAEAIAEDPPPPPTEDKLIQLREMVAEARDLEALRADLNAQLKTVNSKLDGEEGLYFRRLPALMTELGLSVITLEADGNMPSVEAKAAPYYMANIAAAWDEEKRRKAFDYLDDNDAGDLIKTEVTVAFPREQRELAKKFQAVARKYGDATIKENVAWNTLTAWLKDQVEEHGHIPALDIIGGTVARIVKLKEK